MMTQEQLKAHEIARWLKVSGYYGVKDDCLFDLMEGFGLYKNQDNLRILYQTLEKNDIEVFGV